MTGEWFVGRMASFATNFGIVVLKCVSLKEDPKPKSSGKEKPFQEYTSSLLVEGLFSKEGMVSLPELSADWNVLVFHQKHAVIQPACGQQICSLIQFIDTYSQIVSQDFDTICNNVNNYEQAENHY